MGDEEPLTVTQDCEVGMDGECETSSAETRVSEDHHHQEPATEVLPSAEEMRREALREYEEQHQQHVAAEQQEMSEQETDLPPPPRDDEADASVSTGARTAKLDFTAWEVRDAAQRGDYDQLVQYIMDQEEPAVVSLLDEGDVNGWNALHLATRAGRADIVELLLEAGANAHQETNSGRTALDLAMAEFGDDHPLTELLARA